MGDGSNDLLMLNAAGLGIAYNAKQRVQEKAPMRLNGNTLADVLYLLGLPGPSECESGSEDASGPLLMT